MVRAIFIMRCKTKQNISIIVASSETNWSAWVTTSGHENRKPNCLANKFFYLSGIISVYYLYLHFFINFIQGRTSSLDVRISTAAVICGLHVDQLRDFFGQLGVFLCSKSTMYRDIIIHRHSYVIFKKVNSITFSEVCIPRFTSVDLPENDRVG